MPGGRRTLPALLGALACVVWLTVVPARAAPATNDPGLDRQWAIPMINAPAAWAIGTGAGITIAVVDTGVDLAHEDLKDKVVAGKNFVDDTKPPQDDFGHGTHVAGIAAAKTNNGKGIAGVAPDARIMPVKVLDEHGNATVYVGEQSSIDRGIRWAADNGAQVINLSLGDGDVQGVDNSSALASSFADSVQYAWGKGAICVISAGNNDPKKGNGFPTSVAFATVPGIVVTALDRNGTKAGYARGVGAAMWGIAAPGGGGVAGHSQDDILSTWWLSGRTDGYAFAAGTSMAAPHVAAVVAILRSRGVSKDDVIKRLRQSSKDIGDPGEDDVYGWGALDAAAAVAGLPPAPGGGGGGGGGTGTTQTTKAPTGTSGGGGGAGGSRGSSTPTNRTGGSTGTGPATSPDPNATPTAGPDQGPGANPESTGNLKIVPPRQPSTGGGDDGRPWPALAIATALVAVVGNIALRRLRLRPRPPPRPTPT